MNEKVTRGDFARTSMTSAAAVALPCALLAYREDRWIVENNQHGIKNSRYNFAGGQPCAATEVGPSGIVKWYMTEVVPRGAEKPTAPPQAQG